MARSSSISRLPAGVRAEIDSRLIDSGFTGYTELSDSLRHRDFRVSKSALHRYGLAMERRLKMIRAAKEISAAGVGVAVIPSLAGVLAQNFSLEVVPVYLTGLCILLLMLYYLTSKRPNPI